jgi:NAD(P)-dependent dehydrogenase (short-subunit alcohol dehydrogenase family)
MGGARPDRERKSFLVTGACGGLGARVTELLVARGVQVFAADRDKPGLSRIAASPNLVPVFMDVTSRASVARARERLAGVVDRLDGIVCAAGIFAGGPLVEIPEEQVQRAFDVNVMGVFRVVREFYTQLNAAGGRIILISSESTRSVMPFTGPYSMSKRALEAYADSLRRELASLGIRVSVIQPGAFRTALLTRAREALDRGAAGSPFAAPLDRAREMLGREFQKGMAPDRVARLVVHALACARPKPRYRVGNDPLRALLAALPASWADALIDKVLWPTARGRRVRRQSR